MCVRERSGTKTSYSLVGFNNLKLGLTTYKSFPTLQSGVIRFKVKSAGSSFSFSFSRHSRNSRYTRPLKLQLPSMAHLRYTRPLDLLSKIQELSLSKIQKPPTSNPYEMNLLYRKTKRWGGTPKTEI